MQSLFSPQRVGRYELSNRLVMAPMTRSRAHADGRATDMMATYYGQRASVGLVIAEGTQPSDIGQGYVTTPGIYTDAHVQSWKPVADAVHAQGSRLFIQLMHVGRMSHPDNVLGNLQAIAPSAISPQAQQHTAKGMQDIPVPRAMTAQDIETSINDFRHAARQVINAGADGVEIHGANGYLIQQFIAPNSNQRTDAYGGSLENRARFAIEVAKAVAKEIGADRTGIRISPGANIGGLDEGPESAALYRYLVEQLNPLGLAYLHVMHWGNEALLPELRQRWSQTLILNRPGRARADMGADVTAGLADLEAYGGMVLANPDLLARLKADAPLNTPDPSTFFGGTAKGYIDYPTMT